MSIGKILILMGLIFIVVGAIMWAVGKIGIPGDLKISGEKWTFYFPIATSIIASVVLTLLINLFIYFSKK